MTITVDVALYRAKSLTLGQQKQLEEFLSDRWRCDVKIGMTQTISFDLVATRDGEHDHEINKNHITQVLHGMDVLIVGSGMPLHALKPMVDALRGLDHRVVPLEVFSLVENYKGEFQRFSHMNLYRREV